MKTIAPGRGLIAALFLAALAGAHESWQRVNARAYGGFGRSRYRPHKTLAQYGFARDKAKRRKKGKIARASRKANR